jgi:uncharacterized damage-inducible protein DinB
MLVEILKQILHRDLTKLREEITSYKDEETIWKTEKLIKNPAGNLALHLAGNLNTYIGAALGGYAYTRDRDAEFSLKYIPRAELLAMIDQTIIVVDKSLDKINDQQLEEDFPLLVFKEKTTTGYMLVHLVTHLAYHLGQVNYHRRLIESI